MSNRVRSAFGRGRVKYALGASLFAVALGNASAQAACSPDPTQPNTPAQCSGTDADGFVVTTNGTRVTVEPGATVAPGNGPAAFIASGNKSTSDSFLTSFIGLDVRGTVDGGGATGVLVRNGTLFSGPVPIESADGRGQPSTNLNIVVAADGAIRGATAIGFGDTETNRFGRASATLDNSGTILSTTGPAIVASQPSRQGFSSVVNRSGGTIGGITAPFGSLDNEGTITGGAGSAIAIPATTNLVFFPFLIRNSGTIGSTGPAPTIDLLRAAPQSFLNTGMIVNTGTGAAIDTHDSVLNLQNSATGVVGTGGSVALRSDAAVRVVNQGTIQGSIVGGSSGFGNFVDTRDGTIDGGVSFGDTDDRLVTALGTGQLVGNITGAVDGGGGIDLLELIVRADTTITTPPLPTGFDVLQLDLLDDVTLTLGGGTAPANGGYHIRGIGTVRTSGDIVSTGPAISSAYVQTFEGSEALRLINAFTISSTLASADDAAVSLTALEGVVNTGTIAAEGGNGLVASFNFDARLDNSGTIRATGTAATVFGGIDNEGTIASSGGIGLSLSQFGIEPSSNSGRIEGVTIGLNLSSGTLVNTGTITAAGVGVGTVFSSTLDNRAGGVISGGTAAISGAPFGANTMVRNAGTIIGDVDFRAAASFSRDSFIDLGGTVNGNLYLGGGDDVVVGELISSDRPLAGVTGVIDAGDGFDRLTQRVRADTTLALTPVLGFETLGFDFTNDARLTLTASQPLDLQLALAGNGSVDLTADLRGTDRPLLDLTARSGDADPFTTPSVPNDLSVVSRGTLTLNGSPIGFEATAVRLAAGSRFENAGTITVTGTASNFGSIPLGIGGSGEIVNSGTIELDSATGISGFSFDPGASVTNSGSIVQRAGGGASTGIVGTAAVENSGTISVGGPAIITYGSAVLNSGVIASSGDSAITSPFSFSRVENRAGGRINGGSGFAAIAINGGAVINAGTIDGDVDFDASGFAFAPGAYIADGGTLNGNLLFGGSNDLLVVRGDATGIAGTIEAGDGLDTYARSFTTSATVALGAAALPAGFEREAFEARGAATVVTLTGTGSTLRLLGDGGFVNNADLMSSDEDTRALILGGSDFLLPDGAGLAVVNNATIQGDLGGTARSFTNSGTIVARDSSFLEAAPGQPFSFTNSGTMRGRPETEDDEGGAAIELYNGTFDNNLPQPAAATVIDNSGLIDGGLFLGAFGQVDVRNSGTITATGDDRRSIGISQFAALPDTSLTFANSGTISTTGLGANGVTVGRANIDGSAVGTLAVTNTGRIEAIGDGLVIADPFSFFVLLSAGLVVDADPGVTATIVNGATGTIAAPGRGAVAVAAVDTALDLANQGSITGSGGVSLNPIFPFILGNRIVTLADDYLAGAVQGFELADSIRNSGTITGSIDLGGGDDRIENSGTIDGAVFLRAGDDSFVQSARATLGGLVDGGDGLDGFTVDSTGGGSIDPGRFTGFERFTQIGNGSVAYAGSFAVDTIRLEGGTITVAAGQTLATTGATTITGGDAGASVTNLGTIAGAIALGGGTDSVDNRGRIGGSVALGAGDDRYVDGLGSSAAGPVDGGAGIDSYVVALAGDRTGIAARTGFERLGVIGDGTLALTLDQSFDAVSLAGNGLDLRLAGFGVGAIGGSDAAERLAIDGDVAAVALGGGDDRLSLGGTRFAGSYDGGGGNDRLAFTAAGPVTLAGTVAGFEAVALAGNALVVSGTLGSANATTAFDDAAQQLTVAAGGRLLGTIDLAGGADAFRLVTGGTLTGSVTGGAGQDVATLALTADTAITGDALRDFETLRTEGARTLTLTGGTARFDRVEANGGITVAAGATLATPFVQFGGGDDRFAIAGAFAGSADGGAGSDTLALSGGTEQAPIALRDVTGFETLNVTAGLTTLSGTARFDRADVSGGRLIGLAGSTLAAPRIAVAAGATFGSSGTVIGDLAVAGTLSPGASPGTMTVTGNVALATGSVSLFELAPTVSDTLLISGSLAIAQGATLTLTGARPLTPGVSLDLIVAGGGITGSFSTVNKAPTVLGFVSQKADRIQLLGTFANTGFDPQVAATIGYVNAVLTAGQGTPALLAAIPSLLTTAGGTSGAAFARLSPEAYASASQIGVENGLILAQATRTLAAAAPQDEAGAFTFGQALGNHRKLSGRAAAGTSRANVHSYGALGGIGFGSAEASLGAFVGYLDGRQRIGPLDARTDADGIVAGVSGHYAAGGVDLSALLAYDGGKASTRRALPGGGTATGRYRLHSWIGDVSLGYALPLGTNLALRPSVGVTYVSTRRGGVSESGGSPFALAVARRKSDATFVDGVLTLNGGLAPGATVHPWLSAGVRHQLDGTASSATAGFLATASRFTVAGVARRETFATLGAGLAVDLTAQLKLFAGYRGEYGDDGTGHNLNGGLRFRF